MIDITSDLRGAMRQSSTTRFREKYHRNFQNLDSRPTMYLYIHIAGLNLFLLSPKRKYIIEVYLSLCTPHMQPIQCLRSFQDILKSALCGLV